jgi:hypothetical protein
VLVDRPGRARAILNYPLVWAAGDVRLGGPFLPVLEEYLHKGGTLVVNIEAAKGLPEKLLGLRPTGQYRRAEAWSPAGGAARPTTPCEVARVELAGASVLAWAGEKHPLITRHTVGAGAVIVTLVPHLIGLEERAHPCVPYLMNGLTERLLPVAVRLPDGKRPRGEVMYQVNRTKDGYLVSLINPRGIDKTQNGIARVDRRAQVEVLLHRELPVRSAQEMTTPAALEVQRDGKRATVAVRIPAGDVRVVYLALQRS